MRRNIILDTDYYKVSHGTMYPSGTTGLFSYAESRGGEYKESIFFGLQGWIADSLLNPITKEDIEEAKDVINPMGAAQVNEKAWNDIINDYGGLLPLEIKAVPEGMRLPVHNALCTVVNTDPRFPWLTSYVETALIRLWYPTTIATKAFHMRREIDSLYKKFASKDASADFGLLDFACRGVEAYEAAAVGGAAFLTSFLGTDTIPGVAYAKRYYGGEVNGYSVRATEHSVMCSYGQDNEFESFKRLVETAPEGSILSVVSDTWDIYRACEYWVRLAPLVKERNLTLVVRPDSGEPEEVLPRVLAILEKGYETYENEHGYRVFKNCKVLWGDGISEENYLIVLKVFPACGFSPEVALLGSGGGLLQNVNRDTMKFAFKASAVEINKRWTPIAKAPITDAGKRSKPGRLVTVVEKDTGNIRSVDSSIAEQIGKPLMETVYKNGKLLRCQTMEQIRTLVRT